MNIKNNNQDRLFALEQSANRWRLAAISSIALLTGLLVGGMGSNNSQPKATEPSPSAVVGVTATNGAIYRIHEDGSLTYVKIDNPNRTGQGIYSWGDVIIDSNYKNIDKR